MKLIWLFFENLAFKVGMVLHYREVDYVPAESKNSVCSAGDRCRDIHRSQLSGPSRQCS